MYETSITPKPEERRLPPAPFAFVQPISQLRVGLLEGFGELYSPTCPRHAAEPPFLEVPVRTESGASFLLNEASACVGEFGTLLRGKTFKPRDQTQPEFVVMAKG